MGRICGIARDLGAGTVLTVTMDGKADLEAVVAGFGIACDTPSD